MNQEYPSKIQHFRQLVVWQEGHQLVLQVYRHTEIFPRQEVFGLTSQIRRAAVSVTSNIAEGFGRHSSPDKLRFYSIARASVMELQNQLVISRDLGYLSEEFFNQDWGQSEVALRLLNALVTKIRGEISH